MINEIIVKNRFYMDILGRDCIKPPADDWYLISICSPKEDGTADLYLTERNIKAIQEKGCRGYLSLMFSDVTSAQFEQYRITNPEMKLFGPAEAGNIIGFLSIVQADLDDVTLVVHCDAGISRSGAVAQFVSDMWKIPFFDSFIHPNFRVYNELIKAWNAKLKAQEENDKKD